MSDPDAEDSKQLPFHEMGLDDRVLKALAKLGWARPTLIQERAIPLALDGKDLLARGRTGSGKTGAFAVPIVQRILTVKQTAQAQSVSALVLAPTRELAAQIAGVVTSLSSGCAGAIRVVDVSAQVSTAAQRPLLADLPDIVIGTPSRALLHMKEGNLNLKESLKMLVIDEADLIFSFGYEEDVRGVLSRLPAIYQAILTSATLGEDVEKLKRLVLHNPVVLRLEEPQLPPCTQLTQYQIKLEEEDKFVLMYALFKLRLVHGKTIVFVNGVDRCYKLKLFLEQFQIPACVLNSELPAASRCHIVTQFNQGIYDVIVASDEKFLDDQEDFNVMSDDKEEPKKKRRKKVDKDKERSKRSKDKESGVSRGIDFQFVSNVINFDFPPDVDAYIHRVGRTARGNNKGTALSLVAGKEIERLTLVETYFREQLEGEAEEEDEASTTIFKPYKFKLDELEGFRYRARDAWRAVTKIAVREARLKEIRAELLNSDRLRGHFEENPRDAVVLRHDKALHTVRHQPHLRHVPDYIVPKALKAVTKKKGKAIGKRQPISTAKRKFEKNRTDPLKNLSSKRS